MASLSSSSDPAQLLSRAEAAEARVAVADTEIAELKAKVGHNVARCRMYHMIHLVRE